MVAVFPRVMNRRHRFCIAGIYSVIIYIRPSTFVTQKQQQQKIAASHFFKALRSLSERTGACERMA